jgi:hypothetical protein
MGAVIKTVIKTQHKNITVRDRNQNIFITEGAETL